MRTCRVQGVGGTGCKGLTVKVFEALVAAVGEWRVCQRIGIFVLSAGEPAMMSLAEKTVPIGPEQKCEVQRGSCQLMLTTAMVDAVPVSQIQRLLVVIRHTCAYDVRCPSCCKRATSWICRDKSSPDRLCCAYSSSQVPQTPPVRRSCSSSSETPACRTLLRCVSRRLTSL